MEEFKAQVFHLVEHLREVMKQKRISDIVKETMAGDGVKGALKETPSN